VQEDKQINLLGEEVEVRQITLKTTDTRTPTGREEVSDLLGDILDSRVEQKNDGLGDLFDMGPTTVVRQPEQTKQDFVPPKFTLVPTKQCVSRTTKSAKGLINNIEIF